MSDLLKTFSVPFHNPYNKETFTCTYFDITQLQTADQKEKKTTKAASLRESMRNFNEWYFARESIKQS